MSGTSGSCGGSGWANTARIPSLYVISSGGNIFIDHSTQTIDGVYEAEVNSGVGGNIYTCAEANGPNYQAYTITDANFQPDCSNNLTVNGSLIAGGQVKFDRLNGSAISGNPTEVVNYSPLIWLTNPFANIATNPGLPVYDSVTSLPPVL